MLGAALLLLCALASAIPVGAADSDTFAGAWSGQWKASDSPATGPVEVIFIEGGRAGGVLGQFTFVHGAKVLSARREGTAIDGRARFETPSDGRIVLRMEGPDRIVGDFTAGPMLPEAGGSLELRRAR